jgi:hypothetical protein
VKDNKAIPSEGPDGRSVKVTLGGDIMFKNKIPFFVSISCNLKFGMAEMIANQQQKTIFTAVKQCVSYIETGDFG